MEIGIGAGHVFLEPASLDIPDITARHYLCITMLYQLPGQAPALPAKTNEANIYAIAWRHIAVTQHMAWKDGSCGGSQCCGLDEFPA